MDRCPISKQNWQPADCGHS